MVLGVRNKLFGGFGIVLILLIGSSVYAVSALRSAGSSAEDLYTEQYQGSVKTGLLRKSMLEMREAILSYP